MTFIGHDFFPAHNAFTASLLTFGTFFMGALVRPFGAVFSGWLGDRIGLYWTINLCITVMGLSTMVVALIPTYAAIGLAAPLLLLTCRILQGLSAGGQFPGLVTLSVNQHPSQSGFAVGMVFAISTLGFWLASLMGFVLTACVDMSVHTSLWRLPFALSGFFFVIYFYLNRHEIRQYNTTSLHPRADFLQSLWGNGREILAVIFLTTMAASLYMLLYTYLVTYRISHLGVPAAEAFWINSVILLVACFAYPYFGKLADQLGYFRIFLWASIVLLLLVVPGIEYLKTASTSSTLLILLLMTLLLAAIQGAISPLFASAFGVKWRATCCALAYSIGNGLSAGSPLLAEILIHRFTYGLASLFVVLVLLGLVGMAMLRPSVSPVAVDMPVV